MIRLRGLDKYKHLDVRGRRSELLPELNRQALADECGLSRAQISRILAGTVEPSVPAMRAIAGALGCDLAELDEWLKEIRGIYG